MSLMSYLELANKFQSPNKNNQVTKINKLMGELLRTYEHQS